MRNHDAAFAELKSYYNDITRENLNVIKGQKVKFHLGRELTYVLARY